ncbi:MAG: peptidoglycan DD-metalloendopeptidase family protein [Odoribacter sp.]|nr:peptidoglycan DD-metalloendopeptidase family protein [Odoribacter sp.]
MVLKGFWIWLSFVFLLPGGLYAQSSISAIKKEKEKSEKAITYLNKLLKESANNQSASLEKLNILQQKIVQSKRLLSSLNKEVKLIQNSIQKNERRVEELEDQKQAMLNLYADLVYGTWKRRNKMNKLMFIFSSSDFNQAYNRFKYFQQIQEYSERQLELIRQVNDSLNVKNRELQLLIAQKNIVLDTINRKNSDLRSQQNRENQYIRELKGKQKELKQKLQREMASSRQLTEKLNKLISQQAKKSGSSSSVLKLTPEEKLLANDFVKNKGKLPWPVMEGFVSRKFGLIVNTDPIFKGVQVFNNGIDITTSKNADVRSVFKGVVSDIFYLPGYNNVVIIRHGNYFTVYPNLKDLKVKKGDSVNTKELLGKIAVDNEKGNVLNFQVWKDQAGGQAEKLNPELWLAK